MLQLSDDAVEETAWEDLELVSHWGQYLAKPEQYLRHLLPRCDVLTDTGHDTEVGG